MKIKITNSLAFQKEI